MILIRIQINVKYWFSFSSPMSTYIKIHVLFCLPCPLLQACRSSVAALSPSCRLPVAKKHPAALLSLSCRFPVDLSCPFPVASLSLLALLPSCRLPFAFLSPILSLCPVSSCFLVATLSPPCRPPVTLLLPSCRSSPVAFLSPACRFLSLSCRFPAAFLSCSCRHPVVFLSPPCRLPVIPCRISPSPGLRGLNLMDTSPSPFHPGVRTVPVCSVGDTTETEMKGDGLAALAPLGTVHPSFLLR